MMHKAWCNLEEVPYNFSRSSIKFQGHTGWKIDDLNPIWVRLLGRSQLSNPSDLPCSSKVNIWNVNCVWATAFTFDTRKGVLVKVSKFLRPKMSRPEGDLNPQPSDFAIAVLYRVSSSHVIKRDCTYLWNQTKLFMTPIVSDMTWKTTVFFRTTFPYEIRMLISNAPCSFFIRGT